MLINTAIIILIILLISTAILYVKFGNQNKRIDNMECYLRTLWAERKRQLYKGSKGKVK